MSDAKLWLDTPAAWLAIMLLGKVPLTNVTFGDNVSPSIEIDEGSFFPTAETEKLPAGICHNASAGKAGPP